MKRIFKLWRDHNIATIETFEEHVEQTSKVS